MQVRRKYKICLYWAIAITGYYIWFQALYNSLRYDNVFYYTDAYDFIEGILYNFPPIILVFLLNLLIVFKMVKIRDAKIKVVMDVLVSLIMAIGIDALYMAVHGLFRDFHIDWLGTILNDLLILMGVETVYYVQNMVRSRAETEVAKHQALQYKYDALKSQINPHFLFNSLNLLYSLVSIDSEKSKMFIKELARMYRYVMARQNHERVSVKEEFDFMASYVCVLEIRYNNKFKVDIAGKPAEEKEIIPYTMQLLLENVTKHNIISSKSPMTVKVAVGDEEIRITNEIRHKPSETAGNIGLKYLTQLYAAQGKRFHVENDGRTFTAHVPYLTSENNGRAVPDSRYNHTSSALYDSLT